MNIYSKGFYIYKACICIQENERKYIRGSSNLYSIAKSAEDQNICAKDWSDFISQYKGFVYKIFKAKGNSRWLKEFNSLNLHKGNILELNSH